MGKVVMGYWDCPVCGAKEIRGNIASCPSCGRARGDVKFYLKGYQEGESLSVHESEQLDALSAEEQEQIGDNPDWYCSFCNSLNNDKFQVCQTCGASRADSEANYFQMREKNREKEAAEAAAQPHPQAQKPNRSRLFMVLAIVAVAIIALVFWQNGQKTADWEVTALNWQRDIQIEEYKQFTETDWSVPAGAELVSQREAIRTYRQQPAGSHVEYYDEQVYDGEQVVGYDQRDMGNGSIELVPITQPKYRTERRSRTVTDYIQVPVMGTQYTYRIWRWTRSRVASASGSDHDVRWPEVNLGEKEREATGNNSRAEAYWFTARSLTNPEKTVTYRMQESDWMKISPGDSLRISVKNSGRDAYIADESGNRLADLFPAR